VRRVDPKINDKMGQLFGFNLETVKNLSKQEFRLFMQNKNEFEKKVLQKFPCIVTTVGVAATS